MKNRKNWVRLTYDGKNVKAFSLIFSTFTDDGKNIGFFSNFLYLKQTVANSEHYESTESFLSFLVINAVNSHEAPYFGENHAVMKQWGHIREER